MTLLIDIGNTRLKWACAQQGTIINTGALFNHQLSVEQLITIWRHIPPPTVIAISCVNRLHMALLGSVLANLWPEITVNIAQSQSVQCGVHNAYLQPEKLGIDRWLALIAAYLDYKQAVCVADCGTAITVDVVDSSGYHQGGVISPGLTLMKQSLAQGTDQLPFSHKIYAMGLATHTEAAIYNGVLCAAVGLIESVIALQSTPVKLVLTGGDAHYIAAQLKRELIIDDNLVLRGLLYASR